MGLSGYGGQIANKNLEELFAAQLKEELDREDQARLQEEREAQRAFRERDLDMRGEEMAQRMSIADREEARHQATAKAKADEDAYKQTARENMSELAGDPRYAKDLAAFETASGVNVPSFTADLSKPKPLADLVPISIAGPGGKPRTIMVRKDDPRLTGEGIETYREPVQGPAPQYDTVMRLNPATGKMEPFERRQGTGYQPGDQLVRGGGGVRGVPRTDAETIANYDTSLDDVEVLRGAVGDTGILPSVGASLPNWATNITGWGTDAKSQQAVIDRVKQVIGKTLEGGVLRKEDEAKYEKILPVIGDHPDVARAKLDGLKAAVTKRRERTIESLGDAGYDVSGYRERDAAKPTGLTYNPQTGRYELKK